MNTLSTRLRRCAAALMLAFTLPLSAQDTAQNDADEAWQALSKALRPPAPPPEWQHERPSEEAVMQFRRQRGSQAGEAADLARDFYTKHPDHPKAAEARRQEFEMTSVAVELGQTNRAARLESLEAARLKDPSLSEDERFELRSRGVLRAATARQPEGMTAVLAEFEKGARDLQRDFPKRPEVYAMLLEVASASDGDKARSLALEISDSPAPDEVKEAARALLKKMDAVGKPFDLAFTAMDGREVDLSKMKGKVVLIDFWATWCGPCVAEIPNVLSVYETLHPNGFEIVGISFDEDEDALTKFVAQHKMPWVQYFDGKGWQNRFGKEFGITGIPEMWLVDKQGKLRDLNARGDLAGKVERLLAE